MPKEHRQSHALLEHEREIERTNRARDRKDGQHVGPHGTGNVFADHHALISCALLCRAVSQGRVAEWLRDQKRCVASPVLSRRGNLTVNAAILRAEPAGSLTGR